MAANTSLPVSLELFSVRQELAKDLEGTLEAVRHCGYNAVEFAGTPQYDAARTAAALKAAGLFCTSWHVPQELLLGGGDTFKKTVEFHSVIGDKYLIIPWLPDEWLTNYDALRRTAEKLNVLSEKLAVYGLSAGYHNHTTEFKAVDGDKTVWTRLRELTDPRFVMELDTANCVGGGGSLIAELSAAAGRSQLIHLKPYSDKTGYRTMFGEDDIDFARVLTVCRESGDTRAWVVEYECDIYPELDGVRLALSKLREKYGKLL